VALWVLNPHPGEEMARPDFVGWLRNVPRKPWALALPYEPRGEERPMYPDFMVVRKRGGHPWVLLASQHLPRGLPVRPRRRLPQPARFAFWFCCKVSSWLRNKYVA